MVTAWRPGQRPNHAARTLDLQAAGCDPRVACGEGCGARGIRIRNRPDYRQDRYHHRRAGQAGCSYRIAPVDSPPWPQ